MMHIKTAGNVYTVDLTYDDLCILKNAIRRGASTLDDEYRCMKWVRLLDALEDVTEVGIKE